MDALLKLKLKYTLKSKRYKRVSRLKDFGIFNLTAKCQYCNINNIEYEHNIEDLILRIYQQQFLFEFGGTFNILILINTIYISRTEGLYCNKCLCM